MKNYKPFLAGVIVGGVLLSSGNALANNDALPRITNWVKYKFNHVEKTLPSGYTTLNYEGRTYVPARFIAEELGAEVEWDQNTNTVYINKTQIEQEDQDDAQDEAIEEEPTKEEPPVQEEEKDTTKYEQLPVSKTVEGVRLEVYSVEHRDNYTKMYIMIKNTTNKLVRLNQQSAYFKTENDTYEHKDAGKVMYWKDTTWFKDLDEDEDAQGYVILPRVDGDDTNKGTFYIEVVENSLNPDVYEYSFDVEL